MSQAKGSATQVLVGMESTYGTDVAAASRVPYNIAFNSCDLRLNRPLNQAATIRGDRNPTDPFQGNKEVSGNLVVPVDPNNFGFFLAAAIGTPTVVEVPTADVAVASTVTIATGTATFSAGQTGAAVGDRVIWTDGTTRYTGYLTAKTSDTVWTMSVERDAATNAADITGATVLYVITQSAEAAVATVSISSGVMTFSVEQTNAAAGMQIIYDAGGTVRRGGQLTDEICTTWNVVDYLGVAPADEAGPVDLESLEAKPLWTHTYIIAPVTDLPSFTLEKGFLDLGTPHYDRYLGCKVNSMDISIGGDGELLATLSLIGADETNPSDAYDEEAGAPTAVDRYANRFQQFDASAKEGGSAIEVLATATVQMNNNLDTDTFTIGGQGKRRALPEGIANCGGNFSALYENDTVLTKAKNNTESSLEFIFTSGSEVLSLSFPEVKYQQASPAITGPQGIRLELDFQALKADASSALIATLTNYMPGHVARATII